jgi:hypothetical protein
MRLPLNGQGLAIGNAAQCRNAMGHFVKCGRPGARPPIPIESVLEWPRSWGRGGFFQALQETARISKGRSFDLVDGVFQQIPKRCGNALLLLP